MKRILIFLLLMVSSWAYGQSACGQLGLSRCAPSVPPSHDGGGGGNGGSGNGGGESSRTATAREYNAEGFRHLADYDKYHLESDHIAAAAAFKEAWRLDGFGAVGMVELCNRTEDAECVRNWARIGQKEKYAAKYTPEWLKWMEAEGSADMDRAWYKANCSLSIAPPQQGGVVDPRVNVQASLKECVKMVKTIAYFDKEAVKHHDKYLKNGGI